MWKVIWNLDFNACIVVYFWLGKYYPKNMSVSLICTGVLEYDRGGKITFFYSSKCAMIERKRRESR